MDLQSRIDFGHWGPTHSSNPQHKSTDAWIKEEKVKKKILPDKDRKYNSMNVYMKDILKKSLITSVPEITVNKSWTKKIIKILVLILCLAGFIYQTLKFLQIYLSYPTVFSVVVSNPYKIIQPAITICNQNRRRRTALCIKRLVKCKYLSKKELCQNYPRYCVQKPFTGIPLYGIYDYTSTWYTASIAAHNDSMIYRCIKVSGGEARPCMKPYRRIPVLETDGLPNFCYTMESLWGEQALELQTYPNDFYFKLMFKTQPEEYSTISNPVLMRIALHDRRRLVNPHSDGYVLRGGAKYSATVSMTEKKLLPAPYDTNCTDYLKLWRENNGTGPLNDLQCIEFCKLNSLLKEGKCIDKNVDYPHMEEICEGGSKKSKKSQKGILTATNKLSESCINSCGNPCHDYSYDAKFVETDDYKTECVNNTWCSLSRIQLQIDFKKFRLTKTQYQPKFESVEMFSYIGGYMGMWLGLSLVAILDFLETLIRIVYFPIGRWRWRRRKIRRSFRHDEESEYRSQDVHIY